jgi:exodeoxyribonuclease VII small subunit
MHFSICDITTTTHNNRTNKMNENIQEMSFEQALQELEKIVSHLERGDIPLEDSITSYERGVALKKHCDSKLKDAQLKIEKISLNQNNEPVGTTEIPAELAQLNE